MSQRRERFEDFDLRAALADVEQWYHIPALVVLLTFMLWTRLRSWQNFIRGGDVLLSGNDAWYHLRSTSYAVKHWPNTMPFDTWTYFPFGTSSDQFGTLFDQLMATAALVVGLGSPSEQTIAMTVLFAPAVFGMLVAIPVYFAGKRLGGRFGGLVSVTILALSTGGFLQRSLVGFSDHQVGEALFQMIAIVAFMVALSVAEKERPVWELVENREWDALRKPAGWSAIAGVTAGLYIWVWPPAALLIGTLGLYFLLQLSTNYIKGTSPEHLAFVGAVSMVVAGGLSLVPISKFSIAGPVQFSLLQPLLAFSVAFGCVFMAWMARLWDSNDVGEISYAVAAAVVAVGVGLLLGIIPAVVVVVVAGAVAGLAQWKGQDLSRYGYAATVVAILTSVAVILKFLAPSLFTYIVGNLQRVVGFTTGARAGTVGEAQPLQRPVTTLFAHYGLAYISALGGLLIILVEWVRSSRPTAEHLLVFVWTAIIAMATLTQARFEYYLVLTIAVVNAYLVMMIMQYVSPSKSVEEIETFQILTVLALVVVLALPMAIGAGGAATVMQVSNSTAPSAGVVGWGQSLEWLDANTPAEGNYGGAGNQDQMDFYPTVPRQEDFDYPAGSYGVLSWWDYGHWITTRGERIPNANPFQQGAQSAANFLLAPNETHANDVVESISEDDAETRYVMVDWKMVNPWPRANGKFFAPTVFEDDYNVSVRDFYSRALSVQGTRVRTDYYIRNQRYYESMVNRLWHFHGSAVQAGGPGRGVPVINYDEISRRGQTFRVAPRGNDTRRFRIFQSLSEAREFVREDGSAQIGGVGPNPPESMDALEHYRLVRNSNTSALQAGSPYNTALQSEAIGLTRGIQYDSTEERMQVRRQIQQLLFPTNARPPWVKIFERVPGATIEGEGPANANVTAAVRMRSQGTNSTFTYYQTVETGSDGSFEMTVPYSSTGYDELGTEDGYTDVAVQATGPYRVGTSIQSNETGALYRFSASANVTEAQVVGEDSSATTVELERTVLSGPQNRTQSDSGGSGSGSSAIAEPERVAP
jgi:oligosaccharyl transferase (archaeosortase A-associated)